MAVRRVGRKLIGSLLAVNAVVYLTVLILAGVSLNKYIDGQKNHPHYDLRIFFLKYALAGSAIGTCAVFLGCAHLRAWNRYSLASAASIGTTSWVITMLAFGLICKQIGEGGNRGKRLQTLETFIMISGLSQLLYLLFLRVGICCSRYKPTYGV